MTSYEALRLIRHGHVTEVELCRPELLNRFDMTLHRELGMVMSDLALHREVRAVVLSSTGRAFSAGGDIDVMREAASDIGHRMVMIDEGRRLFQAFADFPKPLVVALHAGSYGLGTTVVLTADAIVTTPSVELSDPHVRMGLVAGDGGCVVWPAAVGSVRAKRYLLTGDAITGEEAYRVGLVSDLVDDADEVRPAALMLAERMASLPPLAVQFTKRALAKSLMSRSDEVLDLAFYLEALSFGTEDLLEAVSAFEDHRAGKWKGR